MSENLIKNIDGEHTYFTWANMETGWDFDKENPESVKNAKLVALKAGLITVGKTEFLKLLESDNSLVGDGVSKEDITKMVDNFGTWADNLFAIQVLTNYDSYNYISENYVSAKERKSIPLSDFAWPAKRKYPITSQERVDSAARLVGRAPKAMQGKIKARIKAIAKRKGFKLPTAWM